MVFFAVVYICTSYLLPRHEELSCEGKPRRQGKRHHADYRGWRGGGGETSRSHDPLNSIELGKTVTFSVRDAMHASPT